MPQTEIIELLEEEEYFGITGGAQLTISRTGGDILLIGKPLPINGAIERNAVKGFRLDRQQTQLLLFLDWEYTVGKRNAVSTVLGEISDLGQAEDWIKKVNELYK